MHVEVVVYIKIPKGLTPFTFQCTSKGYSTICMIVSLCSFKTKHEERCIKLYDIKGTSWHPETWQNVTFEMGLPAFLWLSAVLFMWRSRQCLNFRTFQLCLKVVNMWRKVHNVHVWLCWVSLTYLFLNWDTSRFSLYDCVAVTWHHPGTQHRRHTQTQGKKLLPKAEIGEELVQFYRVHPEYYWESYSIWKKNVSPKTVMRVQKETFA